MEVKKAYIYSALDKHKLATEQLAHLHKTLCGRARIAINFLKLSSEEALQAFKITDRYQIILSLQRVIENEDNIVVHEEIKTVYAIFKPLMDKGLPYFWDSENRLLKKDHYDNLIFAKRNDHSSFEDLEGKLRGEVSVAKLGDVFELLNMIKKTIFPQMEVEEYINLEILSIQMKDLMLPTKNHFKELIKMVVKPIGLIPLTS